MHYPKLLTQRQLKSEEHFALIYPFDLIGWVTILLLNKEKIHEQSISVETKKLCAITLGEITCQFTHCYQSRSSE